MPRQSGEIGVGLAMNLGTRASVVLEVTEAGSAPVRSAAWAAGSWRIAFGGGVQTAPPCVRGGRLKSVAMGGHRRSLTGASVARRTCAGRPLYCAPRHVPET